MGIDGSGTQPQIRSDNSRLWWEDGVVRKEDQGKGNENKGDHSITNDLADLAFMGFGGRGAIVCCSSSIA